MEGRKLKNSDALKFIFAGKSIVTFLNTKTSNRFTFKVKQAKDSNMFFVSVLNGPENFAYIGTCIEGKFRHGRKSNMSADAQGRRLTVPSSIENGLGPECVKKLSKMEKRDKFLQLILG